MLKALPEPINAMVLVNGCLGLRISELLALKWEDIDLEKQTITIQRKFTRGKVGLTRSDSSEAALPLARPLLEALLAWKPKTDAGLAA